MSLLHKKWSFPNLFTFTKDIFNGKLHSFVQWLLFAEVCIHTCNLFVNKAPCCSIIKMKTIFAFILSLAFTYPDRWFDSFCSYVPFLYLLKRFQGYGNKTKDQLEKSGWKNLHEFQYLRCSMSSTKYFILKIKVLNPPEETVVLGSRFSDVEAPQSDFFYELYMPSTFFLEISKVFKSLKFLNIWLLIS